MTDQIEAPAAAAHGTKRKLEEGEIDQQEQKESKASKQLVATTASSSALVAQKQAPEDRLWLDSDSPLSITEQMIHTYLAMLPFARKGTAKVRDPNLAMALFCAVKNLKINLLELPMDEFNTKFQIYRKEDKYINFSRKNGQNDLRGKWMPGFTMVTHAFLPAYGFRYGCTEATGVNGNQGKSMQVKGKTVFIKRYEERYELNVGCKPIHPLMVDKDENNPFTVQFISAIKQFKQAAFVKMWGQKAMLKEMKAFVQEECEKKRCTITKNLQRPVNPDRPVEGTYTVPEGVQAMEYLEQVGKYLPKVAVNEADESDMTLQCGASVYRHPRKGNDKDGTPAEDYSHVVHPSTMFANNMHQVTDEGKNVVNLWRGCDALRWRRPDEFEAGKTYDSPFIPIPPANVAFTNKSILFALSDLGFYECSAGKDQCSFKHGFKEQVVWLNDVEGMAKLNPEDLEPCNPLWGNPYAGYYKGPLGWEGKPPADWQQQQDAANKVMADAGLSAEDLDDA